MEDKLAHVQALADERHETSWDACCIVVKF